jgi:putative ABC transport system permease protein
MAKVALRMAQHDRQKTFGAVLGVAFAYLLVGQNICTGDHYLSQATSYIDNAGADIWIGPPAVKAIFGTGTPLSSTALHQARVVPGVAWADPIVKGPAWARLPNGGAQGSMLIGVQAPAFRGGPYNIVKGDPNVLLRPNTVIIDDVDREKIGGVNLGDAIEMNQRRVRVEGFTWGLVTLFGPFCFAEFDFARSLLDIDADRVSFVLVGLDKGASLERVKDDLQGRLPDATVLTTIEFTKNTKDYILWEAGMAGVLGMGIFIGVTVGFVIVTLSMLSSVQQNVREFATLKAVGATNVDLRRLIFIQALAYTIVGSFVGAVLLCQICWWVRSPRLIMMVHPLTLIGLVPFVMLIAMTAALLAIRRVQKLAPASVFQ